MCKHCNGWTQGKPKDKFPSVDDWEDPRPSHPKRRKKKSEKPRSKGCSVNNKGPHVYAIVEIHGWVRRTDYTTRETVWKPAVYWEKRCIGCSLIRRKYYWWGKSPVGRFFNKEDIWLVEKLSKDNSLLYF